MNFNSYIVSETKTAYSVPLAEVLVPKKTFKQKAFTLAETLITLSIIGVVAAITVPTLASSAMKHTYVVGLKKAYNQLTHAMKMIPMEENCGAGEFECAGLFESEVTNIDGKEFSGKSNRKLVYMLAKHLKAKPYIDQNYKPDNAPNCVNELDCFLTEDGMIFSSYDSSDRNVVVDINGPKAPNLRGRDVFTFGIAYKSVDNIKQGTVMPCGSKQYKHYHSGFAYWRDPYYMNQKYSKNTASEVYTGRVLETGKMDY